MRLPLSSWHKVTAETLSRYERTLGEDHPAVRSFLSRTRFDPDIVPLAL